MPLSKPILATISLFAGLGFWNDWWNALMLVDRENLQPLQMFLRRMISNIQFLRSMDPSPEMQQLYSSLPGEGLRMAMVIITIGPMILFYPFIQRYFVKGIMIGSVKG
jgi:putative aldouronate transport system permease protein